MKRESGLSILTVVMDRAEPLQYALPSWLDSKANQIIIVDWSSKKPLVDSLRDMQVSCFDDDRICHVRVDGETHWASSTPYNLALQFVTQSHVLKTDVDVCIVRHDLDINADGTFLNNHWPTANIPNEQYLNGTYLACTSDVIKAGGYDERLDNGYGFEDDSLYHRMIKNGLTRQPFKPGALLHLPHQESKRFENFQDISKRPGDMQELHDSLAAWDVQKDGAVFEIELLKDRYYRAKRGVRG